MKLQLPKRIATVLSLLFFIATTQAWAQTPTPGQIKLFQQLSPAEQAKAIEAFRKGGGTVPAVQQQAPVETPPVVKPRKPEPPSRIEQDVRQALDAPDLAEKKETRAVRQKLKQFGYDLFAGQPTTFAPATDIPVPATYVIGPGDTVMVQLFGKENAEYSLLVNREGVLNFPELGPIPVAGLTFQEMKQALLDRISNQMIGVKASITMGPLRSIRVFVLGDAWRPGSYVVSGLSTITHALFVSGGVRTIGSLRDIQLKRNGEVVRHLDLYDLLLDGDTSGDERLLPGDVIFVPPIGKTAGIGGEVRRPAIYELKDESTVGQLVEMAGGFLPTAYPNASQVERVGANGERTLVDVDLSTRKGKKMRIEDGDVVRVYSVLERMEDIVLLTGHVERPGGQQWHEGMRLTDLIPSVDDLMPRPDLRYVLIKREVPPDRHIRVFSVDLGEALRNPGSRQNIRLHRRDEVRVFSIGDDRAKQIAPILNQLAKQTTFDQPEPIVAIQGNIRFPGRYPLEEGMRLSRLFRAAWDLLPETDLEYGLLVREIDHGSRIEVHTFRPGEVASSPGGEHDLALAPRDRVYLFKTGQDKKPAIEPIITRLRQQATDTDPAREAGIVGVVMDPGVYPMSPGMRVSDLLRAGGGLKEAAYTLQAEITRYLVVDGQYREVAHIPVDLGGVLKGDPSADIPLKPHDQLNIKPVPQWADVEFVEITGEVRFPGKYPISRGEQLSHVIQRAGGLTDMAFAKGAIFTRMELRKKEQEQLNRLADQLEADMASASVQRAGEEGTQNIDEALAAGRSLVAKLRATRASGRMVINLPALLHATRDGRRSELDITLKNGDTLYIPRYKQEVSVLGEVFYPTSHLWNKKLDRDDYINLSGGLTKKADKKLIYIVRANGAVISAKSRGVHIYDEEGWEDVGDIHDIQPGDTIVVPLDIDRIRPLTLWSSVSQIVYQLAIAVATVNSLGVF